MAGHSQFSNRKHRKAKQDNKRSRIFTVLSRDITSAAMSNSSSKLNEAIGAAKKQNMSKANIDKAINKANKIKSFGGQYDDVLYCCRYNNGFFVISASTDNRNRTISLIKAVVCPKGGTIIESSNINRLFQRKGVITLSKYDEKCLDFIFDLDIEDITQDEDFCEIIVECDKLKSSLDLISSKFSDIAIEHRLKYIPVDGYVEIDEEANEKLSLLIECIENIEDVIFVDTNFDI